MTETPKIEPDITPDEWAFFNRTGVTLNGAIDSVLCLTATAQRQALAYLNADLADDDPRKMTRKWVDDLRMAAGVCIESSREADESEHIRLASCARRLLTHASALESYLPPEP
jgi:hypothetical protein